jgi:3-hydroxybutyryl-CoA dehydratase
VAGFAPKVGDEFTLVRHADAYRALYYGAAGGDFNPIHVDHEAGRRAGLGGAILQGLCTMSWMVESAVKFAGDPTRVVRTRTRFSRPVKLGDTVTFRGRVTRLEGDVATTEIAATNQHGDEVLKGGVVELRCGDAR